MLTPRQNIDMKILEDALLKVMYPGLRPSQRRSLYKILQDKKVSLFDIDQLYCKTDDILCSIIRHQDTNYDQMVRQTDKDKARAILGPIIDSKLRLLKGGPTGLPSAYPLSTGTPVKVVKARTPDLAPFTPKIVGHDPAYSLEQQEKDAFKVKAHIGSSPDLTGLKYGDFVVLGASATMKSRWVCECKCGCKEMRRARAITNPANNNDKCADCNRREYLESRAV